MKTPLCCIIGLALLICAAVNAAEPSTGSLFVDLDGDGLDDNLADSDQDGIPDFNRGSLLSQDPAEPLPAGTGIFASMTATPLTSIKLSRLAQFGKLEFCTRSLCKSRGGFGSSEEFGPGNGIGQGAISGGTCIGGVCF